MERTTIVDEQAGVEIEAEAIRPGIRESVHQV